MDMQDINPQLLSRFKAGIMVELHQPDYQIKTSFLKK
jgi:chromosomal replication initiation ATPase DnaA